MTSLLSIPKLRPAPPSVVNDDEVILEAEIVHTDIRLFSTITCSLKRSSPPDDTGDDTNYN